jgi:hypothetical protein
MGHMQLSNLLSVQSTKPLNNPACVSSSSCIKSRQKYVFNNSHQYLTPIHHVNFKLIAITINKNIFFPGKCTCQQQSFFRPWHLHFKTQILFPGRGKNHEGTNCLSEFSKGTILAATQVT